MKRSQNITGDEPFFISGYQAGEILGKTQPIGRVALDMFVNHEMLERVKTGHTGFASEYRYKNAGRLSAVEVEKRKRESIDKLLKSP